MILGIRNLLEHQYVTWKDLIFWVLKQTQFFLELIFIISWLLQYNRNARWVGEKVVSHSSLIQRGMDLYQQFQAVKEGRSLKHLCNFVQASSILQERGLDLLISLGFSVGFLLLLPLLCLFGLDLHFMVL